MAIPRTRPGAYPAVLSNGFRPFFLLGALFGGAAILFWLPLYYGKLETFSVFLPVDWHVHELLFGYLAAVITGFLLTAIPNWTGRLPLQGLPLLALVLLWCAGRVVVFCSSQTGWLLAALVDCGFLLAVVVAAATEIVAGRNWRNLKVLLPVTALLAANIMFHIEAHSQGVTNISRRLGLAATVVLVMVIGGRIIPSFTRNWLARERPGRLPVPFSRFDGITILSSAFGLVAWTFFPTNPGTGTILIAAALLNAIRLGRWAGDRSLRDPLVLILHLSFAFVPIGLFVSGLAVLLPGQVPAAAGIHAFGVGALACMTLAVMSRATLGHTGRELRADTGTCLMFAAVLFAAILRIAAAFEPAAVSLLHMAAALWVIACFGYVVLFGRMLVRPRLQARRPANSV
ncbi:NnrS family protein [Mesorhizobium erdmanii]|uniref:NnrS family protein n=1 Tax=Mesorhizobium erdmanii TaxID=1777866 RepID=UPI00047D2A32|nr:NnrS family protein [Mesorhizobium erdmanii]